MPTPWTYQENLWLVKIVNDYEGRNWNAISEFFRSLFPRGAGRSQQACESHYHSCLRQDHGLWLQQFDASISEQQMQAWLRWQVQQEQERTSKGLAAILITDEELAAYEAQRAERAERDLWRHVWGYHTPLEVSPELYVLATKS